MKHVLIFSLIFFIVLQLMAQTSGLENLSKNDYLAKAEKQKKSGVIMLVTGAGVAAASVVTLLATAPHDGTAGKPYRRVFLVTGIAGLAAIRGSVGFFHAARKNKEKAKNISASAFLKSEINTLSQNAKMPMAYPALAMQIKF